jgi:autophagy-related protein 16
VNNVCFNQRGNFIGTCGEDGYVKVWDANSAMLHSQFHGREKMERVNFSNTVNDPLVMGTSDDAKIYIWNINKGVLLRTLKGHESKIYAGAFVPNADLAPTRIVTGSQDRTIKNWDLITGACEKTYLCLSAVNDIDISMQGNLCISAHFDQQIRLYDLRAQRQVNTIPTTHSHPVTSVSLSPADQNTILTNSRDNTLRLIDIRMCKESLNISHEKYANGTAHNKASMHPSGSIVAVGSSSRSGSMSDFHAGVVCWDLQARREDKVNWCKLVSVSTPVSVTQRISSKAFGIFGSKTTSPETGLHVMSSVAWNDNGDMLVAAIDSDFCIYHAGK